MGFFNFFLAFLLQDTINLTKGPKLAILKVKTTETLSIDTACQY